MVITGSATDVNLDKAALRINGVEVVDSLPHTWNTSQFPNGAYTIELSAIDKAGNSNLASRNVTIDNTLPEVSIAEPLEGAFVRGNIQINGTAEDVNPGTISLEIDSSAVSSVLPYAWDTSGYGDGAHSIELSAVDKAGNNASTTITVTVDNTLPEVSLDAPANNSYVSKIVSIEGNAADSNLNKTALSIDDIEVSSSLPYYWNTTGYTDGEHALSFSAWDMAGNEAAVEFRATVDNTAPIVSIISPLDGALLRQTVEINGTITEMNAYLISLKIDGASAADSIPYLWDTTAYPDGAHSIELNVSDKASNYAEASVNVTIDNTPPLLTVSELNLNPTLNNAEYSLLIAAEADAIIDVNNTPVALDNGSAIYRTNITSGINEFTVTAIDLAGNPSVWKRTILMDEDALPDWYELNVTGTDPLDGDSDSSLTLADEADNGIKDDAEDFDSDRLSNREEFAYGLDPFKSDTDGDGLNDWYELRVTGTNPLLLDSDNNSVNDQNEDKDGDSLDNLVEQGYNTNPLSNDTDEDSLSDYREIVELKTDPLKKDTDSDFLDDSIELKPFFNTNPNNPDTNNNGILDGNETYEQKVGNNTLGIEVAVNASDNREGSFIFEDVGDKLRIDSDVFIGKPINILSREKFSTLKIKRYYDESRVTNESDLAIFYFDEANHSFVLLENQSVNKEENYILAETNHLSNFVPGSIQGYNNQFQNSNAPTIPELKAGDEIRINARVHNIGIGEAKDVAVDFYNGDPDKGGMFIGRNVTASIGGNRSALASVKWKVNFSKGMNIFVKVDPNSTVVETNEDNNNANRFLDNKSVDSDSDGLTDYDEINGLRTGMGKTFYTNPNNPDTDGDGLDDGREMGRVMNGSQGRYYYLFSYPNLTDTDGDQLSDKDEYDFGSSGLDKDTDYDRLSDFEEYQLGTLPRDPDTDRDGLTDWWETVTDTSINRYGATDPKNRDSDGDGAIDGGEANIYNGTLHMGMAVDTNRDGVADSGEMDLNGDGIIEMGEENDYDTPPNNFTYFADVFMVVDEEYKQEKKQAWNPDNWRVVSTGAIKEAGKYFLSTFQVKLNISQIYDGWDSDDNKKESGKLLEEAIEETNWIGRSPGNDKHNSDILLAFTGQDSGLSPFIFKRSYGIAFLDDAATIVKIPPSYIEGDDNIVQHEISHLFGADDYYDGRSSIMDKSWPWPIGNSSILGGIWKTHEWDNESFNRIELNKSEVSRFKEGGDYDITN